MMEQVQGGRGARISRWRLVAWTPAAMVLLVPLVAMRFTDEVNWTAMDFVFAGVLIGGTGLALELAVKTTRSRPYLAGALLTLAGMVLLIWLNAAVGIIGGEDNPYNLLYGNLLYGVVIATALAGAIGAGFDARGMARALAVTAVVQLWVGSVALQVGAGQSPGWVGLLLLNGFFVALFALAAWLFRQAAVEATKKPSI